MDDKRYKPGTVKERPFDLASFLAVVALILCIWFAAGFFSSPEGAQVIRIFFR